MPHTAIANLQPQQAEYYFELGRAHGSMNRPQEAIPWLEQALAKDSAIQQPRTN